MLIGLTGGIACGKSTVSRMLSARGAIIIDADLIARDVVAPGSVGLARVVEALGEQILDEGGAMDRAAVGAMVFADPEKKKALEGIVHPLIAQESMRRLAEAGAQSPPMVVYDAALLIESGRADHFRPLVVITAPEPVQINRIAARDGLGEAAARARIDSQMPVMEKAAVADHVIDNGGSLEATEAQVQHLWEALAPGDAQDG